MLAEQENMILYMPLETAWSLLLEKKVHRIIVFLKDKKMIAEVRDKIAGFIAEQGMDLEVRDWSSLAVYYRQIIDLFSGISAVIGVIIFLVIVFGISNTMYMVVHDRTREIGTLRAMGDSRLQIILQFLTEGLLLGLLGALTALILSLVLIPLINALGIELPPGPGQSDPIPVHIQPEALTVLWIMLMNAVIATAASLPPSLRAVRISIAEALRSI